MVTYKTIRKSYEVVMALNTGHCPRCGFLSNKEAFYHRPITVNPGTMWETAEPGYHECPSCRFKVLDSEAAMVVKMCMPYLQQSVNVFESLRRAIKSGDVEQSSNTHTGAGSCE